MTSPAFSTVVGPTATDSANGATGYNSVAAQTEANYATFNSWALLAQAELPEPSVVVKGTGLFVPAAGWVWEGYDVRENWGKKWGGCTYVSLAMKRTGTAVSRPTTGTVTYGRLVDTVVGTLVAGWRPPSTYWINAVCGAGTFQLYANTAGSIVLYSAGGNYGLRASHILRWTMFFPNFDVKPF